MTAGLPSVERAIQLFVRFPGIGRKSAQRMIHHLLRRERGEVEQLLQALQALADRVGHCAICHNLAEAEQCWICSDTRREAHLLCIVEEPMDLLSIERAGLFRGRYHVLGGRLNPLGGVGPEQLNLATLESRLRAGQTTELIIATNPTVEGEATAHYVNQMAAPLVSRVTRLAYGMPMGGELEYLDESTVYQALAGRRNF
ncbi:MAG: recombination protein RecR [Magnetococcales bacterium]|nr:recombination protein RecR [Magnetococcales bacterium]